MGSEASKSIRRYRNKMPLTKKGSKIKRSMKKTYGPKKGEKVFYASVNKGIIKGAKRKSRRK